MLTKIVRDTPTIRLKKMGVDIISKGKSTAWTEDDTDALRELHAEYKEIFTTLSDIVEAVLDDARLIGKTSGAVKAKLKEIGLVKTKSRPKRAAPDSQAGAAAAGNLDSDDEPPQNTQRRAGELDLDFVQSLTAATSRARELGTDSEQQLAWLVGEMKECADSHDVGRRGGTHIGKTLRAVGDTECIRSLVGMLGFIQELDSDSDSDSDSDDENSKKKISWEIGAAVPGSRLREMISVLESTRASGEDGESAASDSDDEGDSDSEPVFPTPMTADGEIDEEKMAQESRKRAMEALAAKRMAPKAARSTRTETPSEAAPSEAAAADSPLAGEGAAADSPVTAEEKKTINRQRRRIVMSLDSDSESSSDSDDEDDDSAAPMAKASSVATKVSKVLDSDDSDDDDDVVVAKSQAGSAGAKGNKRVLIDSDDDSDEDAAPTPSPETPPKKARADDDATVSESVNVGAWAGETEVTADDAPSELGAAAESEDVGGWAGEETQGLAAATAGVSLTTIAESENVGAWTGEGAQAIVDPAKQDKDTMSAIPESENVGGWAGEGETLQQLTEATEAESTKTESPPKRRRIDSDDDDDDDAVASEAV
jgi:hypothetical protein